MNNQLFLFITILATLNVHLHAMEMQSNLGRKKPPKEEGIYLENKTSLIIVPLMQENIVDRPKNYMSYAGPRITRIADLIEPNMISFIEWNANKYLKPGCLLTLHTHGHSCHDNIICYSNGSNKNIFSFAKYMMIYNKLKDKRQCLSTFKKKNYIPSLRKLCLSTLKRDYDTSEIDLILYPE